MKDLLIEMLRTQLEAQRSKALLTLHLLSHHAVGIGDHSTGDFYKNADEALSMLSEADDKLGTLKRYTFDRNGTKQNINIEENN
jgi:hypothetical protein